MSLFPKTSLVSPFVFFSILGGLILSSSVSSGMKDDFGEKGPRVCVSQRSGELEKKIVQGPVGYNDHQVRALENMTDDQKKQSAWDSIARDVESTQEEKEFSFMLSNAEDRNRDINSRLMILESILFYGTNEKKEIAYDILFSIAQDVSVPFYQRMKIINYVLFYTNEQRRDAYFVVLSIAQDEEMDGFFRLIAAKTIVESDKEAVTTEQVVAACNVLLLFAGHEKNISFERLKAANSIIRSGTANQISEAKAIRDALERDLRKTFSESTICAGTEAQISEVNLEKGFYDEFFKSHPKFIASVLAGEYLPITE